MSILFFFLTKHFRQFDNRILRINDAAWIIRRINNNALRLRTQKFLKSFKIYLKTLCISRSNEQLCPCIFHPNRVFREKRCKGDKLISWIRDGIDADIEGCCSTHCHIEIIPAEMSSESAIYRFCQHLLCFRITGCRRITVQHLCWFFQKLHQCIFYLMGCRNTGISQTEIIYFVCSYDFLSLQAISKELTNHGALTSKAIHGLVYHFD